MEISHDTTVSIHRDDLGDDRLGIYNPMFSEMGRDAKIHPGELIFDLLKAGCVMTCFGGQNFFDDEHPIELVPGEEPVNVNVNVNVNNLQRGSTRTTATVTRTRTSAG